MVHIAIFASGGGSNARSICAYFQDHTFINVSLIITNNEKAGVLRVAEDFQIQGYALSRDQLKDQISMLALLKQHNVDYIILAGYLKLIPVWLIKAFPGKILNIHPSLLPKYGGKGMYGMNVHHAVKSGQEQESGMTVHVVEEEFDKGPILFQASTPLTPDMTPEDIAKAVLILEHRYYSKTIEKFILTHIE